MGKSGKNFRRNNRAEKAERNADLENAQYLARCGRHEAARALFLKYGIDYISSADLFDSVVNGD